MINVTLLIYLAVLVFLIISAVFFYIRWQDCERQKKQLSHQLDEFQQVLEAKITLQSQCDFLQETVDKYEVAHKLLSQEKDQLIAEKYAGLQEVELVKQRCCDMEKQMADWQKVKEEHLAAAKSSMMEAAGTLSSKLLDDHKRESEVVKKAHEKTLQDTTETLHKKLENVFQTMHALNQQVQDSRQTVDVVHRALFSPVSAGSLAEITLENIFKASHLVEEQDYKMQYWVADEQGQGFKPDAVVFLPHNSAVVVDSKASKFFIEIAACECEEERSRLENQLKATMYQHLKVLTKRDYKHVIEEQIKKRNRVKHTGRIDVLMFLPSDEALNQLRKLDGQFMEKAWKQGILPVGPSTLLSHLLYVNMLISHIRQEENAKIILEEVSAILASITKLYDYAQGVGKGLRATMDKYDKFAASFNANFLVKIQKLRHYGIGVSKEEHKKLLRYHVVSNEHMIEGDVVEGKNAASHTELLPS